jgi:hypothetical protein
VEIHTPMENIYFLYFASFIDPEDHSCKCIPAVTKLNALQNKNQPGMRN